MHYKECKIHGVLSQKDITVEKDNRYKNNIKLRCRPCRLLQQLAYKIPRRKEICEKNKEYKKNNRHIVNAWIAKDRVENPEKHKEWARRGREKLGQERNVIEICRRLGVSTYYFHEMMSEQENKCFICKLPETRKGRSKKVIALCLDHCHETGKIGRLLCHNCNTGLGKFKDNIELMLSAIEYIKQYR